MFSPPNMKMTEFLRIAEVSEFPVKRLPSQTMVEGYLKNERKKEWYAQDPLEGLAEFANRHPENVPLFVPFEEGQSLQMVLVNEASLLSLIENTWTTPLCLDSAWRNKNANRAPVTFATGVDESTGRMVPGSVWISSDIQSQTLGSMLTSLKSSVEEKATKIAKEGKASSRVEIVAKKGWRPFAFMIDLCASLRNSIESTFENPCIRVCQFHIGQAILRWQLPDGKKENIPPLSHGQSSLFHHDLCSLFNQIS